MFNIMSEKIAFIKIKKIKNKETIPDISRRNSGTHLNREISLKTL